MKRSYDKFTKRLVDAGLLLYVQERSLRMHVSLYDLYLAGHKVPSVVAARRSVYRELMKSGKSINEVARLFDRSVSGVWKLTRTGGSG